MTMPTDEAVEAKARELWSAAWNGHLDSSWIYVNDEKGSPEQSMCSSDDRTIYRRLARHVLTLEAAARAAGAEEMRLKCEAERKQLIGLLNQLDSGKVPSRVEIVMAREEAQRRHAASVYFRALPAEPQPKEEA